MKNKIKTKTKTIYGFVKLLLIFLFSVNAYSITDAQWRDNYLSNEEKEWIMKNPVIRYSEVNWKPLSIIENNKMVGILGDYLMLVSKRLGIKTKFVPSSSWTDVLNKFKKGEIDLVPGVSGENKLGPLSKSFVSYPMVAVTGDNSMPYIRNLEDVKDKVFSVPKYWTSWIFIKKHLPNAKIIETSSLKEAILNVSQKKADIFIGHIAVSSYSISTIAPSLKIFGELDFEFYHHFLTNEKNKIFLDMANKVFDSMSRSDKLEIYSRWAFSKVKRDVDYAFMAKIILAIIIVFIIIIFYSIKLNNVLRVTKQQQKILYESIDYASTVQKALMSNNHPFDKFFINSFFLWEPKDKVGGDIYLSRKVSEDEILIYIIDCVGHGIPGALLTVYVKAIEQQILPHFAETKQPLNTAKILDFFHNKMLGLYSKNIDLNQALCFDGAVLLYNKKEKIIKFSGANIPIFYIQHGKIKIIKTNRRVIGISSRRDKNFVEGSIDIDTDTSFYVGTDGLMDQLGGKKYLPLGRTRLKMKLLEVYKNNGDMQQESIMKMLTSYQKKNPRLDDITLVGFTIKHK